MHQELDSTGLGRTFSSQEQPQHPCFPLGMLIPARWWVCSGQRSTTTALITGGPGIRQPGTVPTPRVCWSLKPVQSQACMCSQSPLFLPRNPPLFFSRWWVCSGQRSTIPALITGALGTRQPGTVLTPRVCWSLKPVPSQAYMCSQSPLFLPRKPQQRLLLTAPSSLCSWLILVPKVGPPSLGIKQIILLVATVSWRLDLSTSGLYEHTTVILPQPGHTQQQRLVPGPTIPHSVS